MSKIQKGDRVRVTIEGKVTDRGGMVRVQTNSSPLSFAWLSDNDGSVTFEKLGPQVETFKPGDTVRSKFAPTAIYSLGRDGFFAHHRRKYITDDSEPFTSEHYERVSLG